MKWVKVKKGSTGGEKVQNFSCLYQGKPHSGGRYHLRWDLEDTQTDRGRDTHPAWGTVLAMSNEPENRCDVPEEVPRMQPTGADLWLVFLPPSRGVPPSSAFSITFSSVLRSGLSLVPPLDLFCPSSWHSLGLDVVSVSSGIVSLARKGQDIMLILSIGSCSPGNSNWC